MFRRKPLGSSHLPIAPKLTQESSQLTSAAIRSPIPASLGIFRNIIVSRIRMGFSWFIVSERKAHRIGIRRKPDGDTIPINEQAERGVRANAATCRGSSLTFGKRKHEARQTLEPCWHRSNHQVLVRHRLFQSSVRDLLSATGAGRSFCAYRE